MHSNIGSAVIINESSSRACHFTTPEPDQLSSDDDEFKSARESRASTSDILSDRNGFSPSTSMNPIVVDDAQSQREPSFNSLLDDHDEIPPPKTRDLNGEKLQWPSLDSAFDALQEYAKEQGFAVKKSTSKKARVALWLRSTLIVCEEDNVTPLRCQHQIENVCRAA